MSTFGAPAPRIPLDAVRRTDQLDKRTGDLDYVIVGSGAGGGPLAANLARAGFRVLLLEAGGDPCADSAKGKLLYEVPIFHGLSTENPNCQWDYFVRHYTADNLQERDSKIVVNDEGAWTYADGAEPCGRPFGVWYPRAGTLGGCTSHNAMITVTPQDVDWNNVATLTGDTSWCADNMKRYFTRLENCHYRPRPGSLKYIGKGLLWSMIALLRGRSDWRDWAHGHGFDGWLTTSEADPRLVLKDKAIIKLLLNSASISLKTGLGDPILSFATALDPNDVRNNADMKEGLAFTPLAVCNGKRNGPREFLLRTRDMTANLTIQLHALVTRVLFEGHRAVGVEFLEAPHLYQADPAARKRGRATPDAKKQQVFARREVILCGGAFNSPQLLKLSGVGPAEELRRFGIEPVVDLPGVGENLQDRYEVGVVSEFEKPFVLLDKVPFAPPEDGAQEDTYITEWKAGRGLYTSNGAVIGILKRSKPELKEPDLYIFGLPGYFKGYFPGYSGQFERNRDRFTWAVLKAYTQNRAGRVTLRSNDPTEWPSIEFRYFSEGSNEWPKDVDAVADGVNFVREMNQALGNHTELVPGADKDDPQKLRDFIENEAWGHHASCTNQIGPESNPMAVLDSRFRVRRTENLRVVDASVFPRIPGYFIVSAVYMVSEKASDVICEDAQ